MHVCTLHVYWCPRRLEEGVRSLATGVTGDYATVSILGAEPEQQMLLTMHPSLPPIYFFILFCFMCANVFV